MKQIIVIILIISNINIFGLNISFTYKITKDTKQVKRFENMSIDNKIISESSINIRKFIIYDDGFLIIQDTSSHLRTIYDFNSEKVTTIKDGKYDIVSLFSIINYREAEFQNRKYLSGGLKAGGLNDALGGLFGLESLFVIEDKPNKLKSDIKEKNNNNLIEYDYKTDKVVTIEYSQNKLDGRYKSIFSKFLIYNTSIHPLIIKSIVQHGFIPKYIEFNYSDVAAQCTDKYELLETSDKEQSLENLISITGLTPDTTINDSLKLLINKIYNKISNYNISLISKDECYNKNKEFIQQEKYFDALLTLFEYLMQNGDQPADAIKQTMVYVEKNKDMKTFVNALNSNNTKEELGKSIHNLESIDQSKYEKGYIINILLASFYTDIGFNKSLPYFQKVLIKNPYITGVYKDLGDYYNNNYSMDYGWKCFDIALLINKNYPMSIEIEKLKSKFRNDFPEYFIAKIE